MTITVKKSPSNKVTFGFISVVTSKSATGKNSQLQPRISRWAAPWSYSTLKAVLCTLA
jgi:hypothetical protein